MFQSVDFCRLVNKSSSMYRRSDVFQVVDFCRLSFESGNRIDSHVR